MAYATITDVQARMIREMTNPEQAVCESLLEDAAVLIDAYNEDASDSTKLIVSCRMVIRAIGDGQAAGIPLGASQGSMSALGYSQSWTMGSGGGAGELYIGKTEKQMLGASNTIGSYSPIEELVESDDDE